MRSAAFWSSLFILPYTLKPLWAPVVELYKTKKFFVLHDAVHPAGRRGVAVALSLRHARHQLPGSPLLVLLSS
jgi:MFS transporter, PAT family, beta-lactamase induction signal transducer AmpG